MDNRDETFTVPIESVRQQPKIEIAQEPFYLTELDFYHLTQGKPKAAQFGVAVFLSSIGYLVILVAKLAATHLFNRPAPIEAWEWVVVGVSILASIVVYGVASILPCEETRLKKEIKQHFEKSPRARQMPRAK